MANDTLFNSDTSRELDETLELVCGIVEKHNNAIPRIKKVTQDYELELSKVCVTGTYEKDCMLPHTQTLDDILSQTLQLHSLLSRKQKKLVFYGSVSNGKSSIINAILGHSLLPAGPGHTTDVFLVLTGWDQATYHLKRNSKELNFMDETELHKRLQKIVHVKNMRDVTKVPIVTIKVPTASSHVMHPDTLFIDCPGENACAVFDEALREQCQDADVFVVVTDAERVLTVSEKRFLEVAANQLGSTPVIFAVNKWDRIEKGERKKLGKVWKADIESFVRENLPGAKFSEDRVHLISAKEAMQGKQSGSCDQYTKAFQSFENTVEEFVTRRKGELASGHFTKLKDVINSKTKKIIHGIKKQTEILRNEQMSILDELNNWDSDTIRNDIIASLKAEFDADVRAEIRRQEANVRDHVTYFCSGRETTEEVAKDLCTFMKQTVVTHVQNTINKSSKSQIESAKQQMINTLSEGLEKHSFTFSNSAGGCTYTLPDLPDLNVLVPAYKGETLHLRRHRPGGVVGAAGDRISKMFGGRSSQEKKQRRQIDSSRQTVINTYTNQLQTAISTEQNNVIEQAWQNVEESISDLWEDMWNIRISVIDNWKQSISSALLAKQDKIEMQKKTVDNLIGELSRIDL